MQKLNQKSSEVDKFKTMQGQMSFSNEKLKFTQDQKDKSNEKNRLASSRISFKEKSNEKEKERLLPNQNKKLKPNSSQINQKTQFTSNLIEKLMVLIVNLQRKLFTLETGYSSNHPPLPSLESVNILKYQEKIIKNEAELDLAKKSLMMYIDYIKEIEERRESYISEDGQIKLELEKLKNENAYLMEVNKRLEEEILSKLAKIELYETPEKHLNEPVQLFPMEKASNEKKSNENLQNLLDSSFPPETIKRKKNDIDFRKSEINRKNQSQLTPSDFPKQQQVRKNHKCDLTPDNLARKPNKHTNDLDTPKDFNGLIESINGLSMILKEFLSQNKEFSLENEFLQRLRSEKRNLEERNDEIIKVGLLIFKNFAIFT